jgi:DNA polymerase V
MTAPIALVDCNNFYVSCERVFQPELRGKPVVVDQRLEGHARDLRRAVLQCTGIPVSIGIAPTKTLAKVANRRAKKDAGTGGVFVLSDEAAIDAELAALELTDLWGVAGRLAKRPRAIGITTPLALKQADPRFIRERFNVVVERLVQELRGVPCISLEEAPPDRKSITASRSFGRTVETRAELEEAVGTYASRAAEKLRGQGLAVNRIMVFAHTNPFKPEEPQYTAQRLITLPVATADTGKLIAAARRGLGAIWRQGYRYKKAGIMLLDLVPAATVQGALFDRPDTLRSQARMRAIDHLNRRYGRDTVSFATAGRRRGWKLRSAFLSQRYTTNWDELLRV